MNSIVEAVFTHTKKDPFKVLFADSQRTVTRIQAKNAVIDLTEKLQSYGVRPGECVLVECSQDVFYYIAVLAVQLIGGISVPLEKKVLPQRIEEIRGETDAKYMISRNAYEIPLTYISMDEVDFNAPEKNCQFEFPKPESTAEILFSTGTTGKSKGIEHTHGSVIAVAENVVNGVQMKENGVELVPMPLSHSHGLRRSYANILFGNTVVVLDGVMMVKQFFRLLDEYKVTAIDLSPSALQILKKLTKDRLADYRDQLDYIQIGTAPLSEAQKDWLTEMLPNTHLYNFYGTTEGGCSCIMDFSVYRNRPACIGKPTCNARFLIVDEHRNQIRSSRENTGYLAYSGGMNMKGYWRNPELTAEVMEDGVIYSNDVGFIDEEGFVYMLGRDDDVINYSGIKISPEEVESVALTCAGIADCACVPMADSISGQKPKLFVVMEEGVLFDLAAFTKEIRTKVDQNKVPAAVEVINEIPRTPNGKILRRVLRQN